MADVFVQFDSLIADTAGRLYTARVCGGVADDGLWDGWIEFEPQGGGETLHTPRETKQPNRMDLEYWATGLSASYLEGALQRARAAHQRPGGGEAERVEPTYRSPASTSRTDPASGGASAPAPTAVLDPFAVYAQGEEVLMEELGALDEGHLRNIIKAHGLARGGDSEIRAADRQRLADIIIAGVRERVG